MSKIRYSLQTCCLCALTLFYIFQSDDQSPSTSSFGGSSDSQIPEELYKSQLVRFASKDANTQTWYIYYSLMLLKWSSTRPTGIPHLEKNFSLNNGEEVTRYVTVEVSLIFFNDPEKAKDLISNLNSEDGSEQTEDQTAVAFSRTPLLANPPSEESYEMHEISTISGTSTQNKLLTIKVDNFLDRCKKEEVTFIPGESDQDLKFEDNPPSDLRVDMKFKFFHKMIINENEEKDTFLAAKINLSNLKVKTETDTDLPVVYELWINKNDMEGGTIKMRFFDWRNTRKVFSSEDKNDYNALHEFVRRRTQGHKKKPKNWYQRIVQVCGGP